MKKEYKEIRQINADSLRRLCISKRGIPAETMQHITIYCMIWQMIKKILPQKTS